MYTAVKVSCQNVTKKRQLEVDSATDTTKSYLVSTERVRKTADNEFWTLEVRFDS